MESLQISDEAATQAMAVAMGTLNAAGIDGVTGSYGLMLAAYVACKNTLAMTDADYLRFAEFIMNEYGQDKIIKEQSHD